MWEMGEEQREGLGVKPNPALGYPGTAHTFPASGPWYALFPLPGTAPPHSIPLLADTFSFFSPPQVCPLSQSLARFLSFLLAFRTTGYFFHLFTFF